MRRIRRKELRKGRNQNNHDQTIRLLVSFMWCSFTLTVTDLGKASHLIFQIKGQGIEIFRFKKRRESIAFRERARPHLSEGLDTSLYDVVWLHHYVMSLRY